MNKCYGNPKVRERYSNNGSIVLIEFSSDCRRSLGLNRAPLSKREYSRPFEIHLIFNIIRYKI